MNQVAFLVVESLIKYGPTVGKMVKDLLSKDEVTEAEIDALIASIEKLDFDKSRYQARKDAGLVPNV